MEDCADTVPHDLILCFIGGFPETSSQSPPPLDYFWSDFDNAFQSNFHFHGLLLRQLPLRSYHLIHLYDQP